jgi:hypothetical protein
MSYVLVLLVVIDVMIMLVPCGGVSLHHLYSRVARLQGR